MTTDYGKRYPFAALDAVLRKRLEPVVSASSDRILEPSIRRQADLLRVDSRQVCRWRDYGVTWDQADECAVRLGLHPAVIWPEWRADGLTPLDDEFVNGGGWRTAWEWDEQRRPA